MFQSIIISSYAAACIIYELTLWLKKRSFNNSTVLSFLYEHFYQLLIIFLWLVSLYFESQGGRAAQLNSGNIFNFQGTIQNFINSLHRLDHFYIFQLCCVVGLASIIAFRKYRKTQAHHDELAKEKTLIKLLCISVMACIGTILYLILLCAVAGAEYISRTNCMISWMFWLFVMEISSLAYLVKRIPASQCALPLFILCLIFETFMHGSRYSDIAYGAPETIKEIDDYMIQQVAAAEKSGQNCVEIHIPLHNNLNWPLNTSWGGERIAVTLYRHGITDKVMNITLIPDKSVNERFHF